MKQAIHFIADIVNDLHDLINYIVNHALHLNLTDKDLHFWIIGIIGFFVFLMVLVVSKYVAKLPFGLTILSFLYSFTFVFALVFAIEIQQAITDRGNMEFQDAIIGLYGFLAFFFAYAFVGLLIISTKRLVKYYKGYKGKHAK